MTIPASATVRLAALHPSLPQVATLYVKIANSLTPAVWQKIARASEQLSRDERHSASVTTTQLQTRAKSAVSAQMGILGGGGIPAGADIEELAFVVLMNATNDQDNDLQDIMNEVQAQTKAKQFLRQQMQLVNTAVANNASQQASQQNKASIYRTALANLVTKLIHHK